jgi:hypothetical protein
MFQTTLSGKIPLSEIMSCAGIIMMKPSPGDLWFEFIKRGYFDKEFADVKLLSVSCGGHDPLLFTVDYPITNLSQIKNMKLRAPGGVSVDRLATLGAVPVAMPMPEAYDAMSKGVVQGTVTRWEASKPSKLYELVKSVPGYGPDRCYYVLMN